MVLQPIVKTVNVDLRYVLQVPIRIVINLLILVIKYHAVIHKVLSKIQLRVGAVQRIVQLNRIVTNLLVLVELYHIVVKKMVLQPTMLPVNADLQNVLLVLFVINLPIHVLQVIAEQMQLPRKLCQIVKLSIHVVDVQNANPNGIQTTAPKLALIP